MRAYLLAPIVLATALTATACSSSKSNTGAGGNSSTSTSSAATTSSTVQISVMNGHLVGADGKTLYYNTVDTVSNIQCTGTCASIWPPVLGTALPGTGLNAADFKTVMRPDGGTQVTFSGHPLYEFGSDSSGTTKGAGIADGGGKWIVAPKAPPAAGGATSSSSSEMSSSSSNNGY